MAVLAALLALAVGGCHHCPPPPSPAPPAPPPIAITIGGDCDIASPPEVLPGDMVRICYFGPCEWIDIDFGGTGLFGVASVRLNHGDCVDLRVVSPPEKTYVLTLSCSCETGSGHTTPEIKVGGGP
jgi:hypothetical protein